MTSLRDTLLYTVSLQKLDLQLVARLIISLSPHAWFIMSILILMKTQSVRHTNGEHRMPTHMYASTCTAASIPIPCTETRNIRMHSDPCERTQTRIQSDTPLAAEPRCARPHLYPILPAVSPDASRISAQTFRASVAEHAEQRGQPAAAVTSRPSAA